MGSRTGASSLVETAVLDAARRVFAERGFGGASVDAVAAAAGLTKGAVYSRFPSKEALFVAAALGRDEEVLAEITGDSPAEWARSWARSLDSQRLWTLLAMEFRLYGLRNPDVADQSRDWQRESHLGLREEIRRRIDGSGRVLRVDDDAASAILAAVSAGLALQHYTDDAVDVEGLMQKTLEVLTDSP